MIPAGKSKRHAHADCYLREKAKNPNIPSFEIIDPGDIVKCIYCKKIINKKQDKYIQITNSKYAHPECAELENKREKTDAEKLDEYIMKLYGYEYVPPRMKRQIKQYIEEFNFTYSGMLKSLHYFYEIKGHSTEESHGSLGIIPFIYQDAFNYFYNIWSAQQKNISKDKSDFEIKSKTIRILNPERKVKKKNLFSFLDQEE